MSEREREREREREMTLNVRERERERAGERADTKCLTRERESSLNTAVTPY